MTKIRMAGSKVSAPNPEPSILVAISKPKFCKGIKSEKSNTKKPADTDMTFITMALPFVTITFSTAVSALFVSLYS